MLYFVFTASLRNGHQLVNFAQNGKIATTRHLKKLISHLNRYSAIFIDAAPFKNDNL
jgi:hypothetical protein